MLCLLLLVICCIAFPISIQNYLRMKYFEKEIDSNFRPGYKKIVTGVYQGFTAYVTTNKKGYFLFIDGEVLVPLYRGFNFKSAYVFNTTVLAMTDILLDDFEPILEKETLEWLDTQINNLDHKLIMK